MDRVEVVGVSAVALHTPDDLGIVVEPVWVDDPDVLRRLGADVAALPQHLLPGQQLRIHADVHHRVDLGVHHLLDLLIREAGDVQLEGPQDLPHEPLGHCDLVGLEPAAIQEAVHHLQALVVWDVWIVAREVHQQDPALVVAVALVVVVQLHFYPVAVVLDAFALLTGVVVVNNEGRYAWRQYLITEHVVDRLVPHHVAGDEAGLAALAYDELLARLWPVSSLLEISLEVSRLQQLVHLEELSRLLEVAPCDGLGACLVYVVCIVE